MKKIAIVAHGLSDGGAERVAALLANKFCEQGNEILFIAVYSNQKQYELNSKIKYFYIDVEEKNKFIKMIKRSNLIDKALNIFNADITISFVINEMIITNIKHKIPIIYSLRIDPQYATRKKINKIICSYSYRRAKNIVFQTPDALNFFDKKIRGKGVIIGNPLTSNLPYWKDFSHNKTIITACRITPQKNLKMLIDAFYKFHKKNKEFYLEIYGNGPLKEELEKYCMEIQINEYVKFCGYVENIHEIMAKSSIFALTSDFEGLSNSMLEALAIGTPTICTDCPPRGASLYIRDNENGMLINVGDTEELKNRLLIMAENKQLCEKFSEESIKIRNELSEDTIIKKWNDILNNN